MIKFQRDVTVQGTDVWRQFLPSVDKRWPAVELVVEPTEPHPGVVTGWDVQLLGLGEGDLFYPKTPGFHGPGPLAIGAWLLDRPQRSLLLRERRFRARVDVKELTGSPYVLKPGDPTWLRGVIELKRARILIDLEWYLPGAKDGPCGAPSRESSRVERSSSPPKEEMAARRRTDLQRCTRNWSPLKRLRSQMSR